MTGEHAATFFLFAMVAALTPGPSNLLLTSTGATIGVRRGLPCLCGVAVGTGLLMSLVTLGLGSLVLGSPVIVQALKWCGSGFLLWLSWKIATAGRIEATDPKQFLGFWQAAAFQWVNPKSWLVSVGAIATFFQVGTSGSLVQSLFFGLLFVLAALPSCFVWLAFGAALQRLLHTPRAMRCFHVAMGALLAGAVLLIVR